MIKMAFQVIDYELRVVELSQFSRSNHQSNWKVKSRAQAAAWNWRLWEFEEINAEYDRSLLSTMQNW